MGDPSFDLIFAGEGAIRLGWEVATRCTTPRADGSPCWSDDTKQPDWNCATCGGLGVTYAASVTVRGLFRDQSRWTSKRMSGEHGLGQAQLTTSAIARTITPACRPGWTDDRVRDRFTVLDSPTDAAQGRIFYVATQAVPFLFAGVQEGWRVSLQSMDQATRVRPQP